MAALCIAGGTSSSRRVTEFSLSNWVVNDVLGLLLGHTLIAIAANRKGRASGLSSRAKLESTRGRGTREGMVASGGPWLGGRRWVAGWKSQA